MNPAATRVRIAAGLAALAFLGAAVWFFSTLSWRRPNVILITVDTLRTDHLGAYGYERQTSQHLDRFAEESVLFRHAYAHAPSTNPSLASLMTAHYPHETATVSNFHTLPSEAVTLAELLKAEGYLTAAVVGNPSLARGAGFEQGFDVYEDDMDRVVRYADAFRLERQAPSLTQAAMAWLDGHHEETFFLWVHYMDPHGPYVPPASFAAPFTAMLAAEGEAFPVRAQTSPPTGRFIPEYQQLGDHRDPHYYVAQYDGEIRWFDYWFGSLVAHIRKLELLENTLIIFTADHGEGLGEHEFYFNHDYFVYDELIWVPLLVRLPGGASGGKEIVKRVAHVDILPTVLDAVGVSASERVGGETLFRDGGEAVIYAEAVVDGVARGAVIHADLKLVQGPDGDELYDLRADAGEVTNLLAVESPQARAASVADLRARLKDLRERDRLALGSPRPRRLNQEMLRKLEALGYVKGPEAEPGAR